MPQSEVLGLLPALCGRLGCLVPTSRSNNRRNSTIHRCRDPSWIPAIASRNRSCNKKTNTLCYHNKLKSNTVAQGSTLRAMESI